MGAILLLASGCAGHVRVLQCDKPFDSDDKDAIVVLRVTPGAWVMLARGKFDRNGWRAKWGHRKLWSENGFVVARVTPTEDDEAYGIVQIRPERFTSRAEEPAFTYATALWSPVTNNGTIVMFGLAGYLAEEGAKSAFEKGKTVTASPAYTPKGEAHLPVFEAIAGEVTYVGAIRIDASKDPESDDPPEKIGVPNDAEAVARFMAKRYPNVHARLTTRTLQMMRWNELPPR
jgi:hypothetical protein